MKKNILLVVSMIFITGCAIPKMNSTTNNGEPKWINNPYIDKDKAAASACAKIHFQGESAQRKLAISRALDALATQKSVTVSSVTLRNKHSSGVNTSSSMDKSSLHDVDKVKLSTKIKDIYKRANGDICVWVVEE